MGLVTRILYLALVLEGVRYGLAMLPGLKPWLEPLTFTRWVLSPTGLAGLLGYFVSQWLHLALDRATEPRRRRRVRGS